MLAPPLPAALLTLVEEHGASHAPHYPPSAHSDHGPMAYLAMHGLGLGQREIERFAAHYRQRLEPLPVPTSILRGDDWHEHVGCSGSYAALRPFFERETRVRGWQATLARYLPSLISGWVVDLFHPLIRLGYGIEFEVQSEIAAGLAYLASAGDEPRLAVAARFPAAGAAGRAYLEGLPLPRSSVCPDCPDSFNRRYRQILQTTQFRPSGGAPASVLAELGRACLEVFDSTHDFFALHLVTATHAFRVCSAWAGPSAEGIYSVGIALAYLALGAPAFRPVVRSSSEFPSDRLASASDEHDLKLAYACRASAQAHGDPSYEWVAHRYLDARLPR
jgi:hypothetical protein